MYTKQEVIDFVYALNVYKISISSKTRAKFIDLYQFIFEQSPPCEGCPSEIESALNRLKIYCNLLSNTEHTHAVKSNLLMKYKMNDGVVIYSTRMNMMVSQFNCTDAIAQALIEENSRNIQLFTITVDAGDTYSATVTDLDNVVTEDVTITEEKTDNVPTQQLEIKSKKRKRK